LHWLVDCGESDHRFEVVHVLLYFICIIVSTIISTFFVLLVSLLSEGYTYHMSRRPSMDLLLEMMSGTAMAFRRGIVCIPAGSELVNDADEEVRI
jgi:hypothetical protein